ncbi:MAG: ATP-dependent 6-phosphofructokinase [Verrucomicrobia bacterium]|nr:ATP-dependent 6-phosphofructokinase [Verrucomicrobiota bacterium]
MGRIIPIDTLGECKIDSPFKAKKQKFFHDDNGVIRNVHTTDYTKGFPVDEIEYFQRAGAREKIYFKPEEVIVGIVTCGGLCPGLNDVIRAVTFCAHEGYGVKKVLGFQYGYEGLVAKYFHPPVELSTDNTDEIHEKGGTILKSSRGPQDPKEMVRTLIHYKVNVLITIGGDGTLRGSRDIQEEITAQNLKIAVIGVPKTIDNDIGVIERSFGYETAVQGAWEVVKCAHAEAKSVRHGVGLVKLMGRESGWIAASTATSNSNVNFCLVPEVPFDLDGQNGFFEHLRLRLERKDHAVVVVAEGAGQNLIAHGETKDKSGNKKLADIGVFLRDEMQRWFASRNTEINIKYFDPSYLIRSTPANANDAEYCLFLGYNAMHAAMAGKTGMVVGLHNHRLVHLPISMIGDRKLVDPHGWVWQAVLQSTRQPVSMLNRKETSP